MKENILEIKNLSKAFGKNLVLRDISLDFTSPGIYAVLGPNGSGKTTLIKSILGMVLPDSGDIEIAGNSILKKWEYRQDIAYLPQIARFPENLRVSELFTMVLDLRKGGAVNPALIELFGLEDFLDKHLSNLSGGTRQKVNLLLAFLNDCPLVILDEPTAGLDPVSIVRLKSLIRKEASKGKIIIITSHVMSLVEDLADEIIFLLEGNIHFRGTIATLQKTYGGKSVEEAIAALLEMEAKSLKFSGNGTSLKVAAKVETL